jgi:transcriptional regulator with XRE-family HTH domain
MDVGRKVRRLRRVQDLSQDDLATRVGVSRNTISRFETGARMPSIEMLEKLATALGVKVADLLAEEAALLKAPVPLASAVELSSTVEDRGRREDSVAKLAAGGLETIREFLKTRTGTDWIALPDAEYDQWWLGVPREKVKERYEEIEEEWRLLKYEMEALRKGEPTSILTSIDDLSDVWGKLSNRALEARYSVPRKEESDQEFQRRRLEGKKHRTFYESPEVVWPKADQPLEEGLSWGVWGV